MSVGQALRTAVRNLRAHKGRFAQVALCMVAGVAAVIVVCNLGMLMVRNAENVWKPEILSNVSLHFYSRVDLHKQPSLEDMEKIVAANPDVFLALSPLVFDSELEPNIRYGDKYFKNCSFSGVDENYLDVLITEKVAEGRFLQYMDCRQEQNVCVIGADIAEEMGGDPLGKSLKIWGVNFTVIGVMESSRMSEGEVYVPYTCAQKIVGDVVRPGYQYDKYYRTRFELRINGLENISRANDLLEEGLRKVMGANEDKSWYFACYTFLTMKEQYINFSISTSFNYMLLVFAVLIVGGVGIMNVMLAAVQERTKEIGIRKAFGATNKDIVRQFILEAAIISLLAGLLGAALGVLISWAMPWLVSDIAIGKTGMVFFTSSDMGVIIWPVLLAVSASAAIGVIFGYYPALKAAKMEPVAAINSD